jgi:predicted HTH transcriptional regulator
MAGLHPPVPARPRTGPVEVWGHGTNRVIEMCQKHGAPPPVFEEKQGFLVVMFRAQLVAGGMVTAVNVLAR